MDHRPLPQFDESARFLDGYWRSGDVGTVDKHRYLKLTDRLKDVIRSGGEWISSIDMEKHPHGAPPHPRTREAPVRQAEVRQHP